jgi:hypothetical protein
MEDLRRKKSKIFAQHTTQLLDYHSFLQESGVLKCLMVSGKEEQEQDQDQDQDQDWNCEFEDFLCVDFCKIHSFVSRALWKEILRSKLYSNFFLGASSSDPDSNFKIRDSLTDLQIS